MNIVIPIINSVTKKKKINKKIINSVTSVNLKKAGMASRNIVMKKTRHVVMISFIVVFGLLVF